MYGADISKSFSWDRTFEEYFLSKEALIYWKISIDAVTEARERSFVLSEKIID